MLLYGGSKGKERGYMIFVTYVGWKGHRTARVRLVVGTYEGGARGVNLSLSPSLGKILEVSKFPGRSASAVRYDVCQTTMNMT